MNAVDCRPTDDVTTTRQSIFDDNGQDCQNI